MYAHIEILVSAGNISGSLNSMSGTEGFCEEDLEKELEELFHEDGFTELCQKTESSFITSTSLQERDESDHLVLPADSSPIRQAMLTI